MTPDPASETERQILVLYGAGKTVAEIAIRLGITKTFVMRTLKVHGLQPLDVSEPTLTEIKRLYQEEGYSLRRVSQEMGIEFSQLRDIMRRYGIPRRTRREAQRVRFEREDTKPYERVARLSAQGRTLAEIGEEIGVSGATVCRMLQRLSIKEE